MDLAKLSNTPASPHGEAGWTAWQQRRRHFFVLTAAGKPVYSRHGDEQALAGFMAVIQALLSVMSDQGDVIHSISVGTSSIEFLLRGQLYLVAVSSRGEAQLALRRQLELLYQSILMVATGGIERLLTRSPGYDVQQLLAGAKPSMNALISGYGDCPGWMMASVEPAPTAAADRQRVTAALQDAVQACECLYGVLLVAGRVVAVERGAAAPALNVFDLLLLINFSSSNESLRHNETFVPVCLPNFQPNAFVHAYVNCLDQAGEQQQQQQDAASIPQQQQQSQHQFYGGNASSSRGQGTFLLLLSGSADAFHKLSAAQHSFVAAVTSGPDGGVLARVQAAAVQPRRGRVRVEALPAPLGGSLGSTPLWHALIRYPQRHQHITLAYPQQLFAARSQVKQLVRSYCRLYCAAYGQLLQANAMAIAAGPFGSGSSGTGGSSSSSQSHAATVAAAGKAHKLLWVTSQRWVTGVLVDRDVEVYATFDPLTEKDVGLKMAETLKRLFGDRARRQDLLVPGL